MTQQLQLGRPVVNPYTWSKIGKIDGNDLYLCDTSFTDSRFGDSNDYASSAVRKKCLEFYHDCFSDGERALLVNHPEIGDPVFLLSNKEFMDYYCNISFRSLDMDWWLRSHSGFPKSLVAYVGKCSLARRHGVQYISLENRRYFGIRPAIILKKENDR